VRWRRLSMTAATGKAARVPTAVTFVHVVVPGPPQRYNDVALAAKKKNYATDFAPGEGTTFRLAWKRNPRGPSKVAAVEIEMGGDSRSRYPAREGMRDWSLRASVGDIAAGEASVFSPISKL